MWLFLLFIAVPILEIILFIKIGGILGVWITVFVVILTAIVGTRLVKSQGINAINNVKSSLLRGQDITQSLINGALILIAGILLLTPGFFTDFIGLTFLIPKTRNIWVTFGIKHFSSYIFLKTGSDNMKKNSYNTSQSDVIDGEYKDLDK